MKGVFLWQNLHFNSQPHEEADAYCSTRNFDIKYFNSQPHEEADNNACIVAAVYDISTHSLTRRLTGSYKPYSVTIIFQLTASRGG